MKRIVDLLIQKNHYLEKFFALNLSEITRFEVYDFDGLDEFYNARENILKNIQYVDEQIRLESDSPSEGHEVADKKDIAELLRIKDEYVHQILQQDLQVLSLIESAKSEIIRELHELKANKKAVGSYKSRTFQNRLDEKL